MAWAQHVDNEAAGIGGTSADILWGRIPGPPPTDSTTMPSDVALASASKSSPSSNTQVPAGLHHQFSIRLGRLPSNMFRLASMSSSSNNQSSSIDGSLSQNTSSAAVTSPPAHVPVENVAKRSPSVTMTQSSIMDGVRKVSRDFTPTVCSVFPHKLHYYMFVAIS